MLKDRGGNFGMMAALVSPLLLAAGGVAIDMANMVTTKNQMQDAADAAALAAASALVSKTAETPEKAKEIALNFLGAQATGNAAETPEGADGAGQGAASGATATAQPGDAAAKPSVDIKETAVGKSDKAYKVTVVNKKLIQFNAMTRLLGQESIQLETIAVAESATETQNAMSMYLVLDRSGSMAFKTDVKDESRSKCVNWTSENWGQSNVKETAPCYFEKIVALKSAVEKLLKPLADADPGKKYVRVGAVSYESKMNAAEPLAWGTTKANTYVQALQRNGGTDSSGAFAKAVADLKLTTENDVHKTANGLVPKKFIVFMTDGENTHLNGTALKLAAKPNPEPEYDAKTYVPRDSASDTATLTACADAKKAGIRVFTIAFMAPNQGKSLLERCASNPSDYKAPEKAEELLAVFGEIGAQTSGKMARLTK